MAHLNVLGSVKNYDDLPSTPKVDDFVFLVDEKVGIHYTIDGWKFLGLIEPFQLIVLI